MQFTKHAAAVSQIVAIFAINTGTFAGDYPVAGISPQQRPQAAPVISQLPVSRQEQIKASGLTGISQPTPTGLNFLDNQGNWYTPFTRPGMLPPYDLRGWHNTSTDPNSAQIEQQR